MYLGDYHCREDRNLGFLGADGDVPWQEVTYLPRSFQAGQDTGISEPTYFDPSANADWLAGIGFTASPTLGRHKIDVPDVQVGFGEQSSMGPGPLPDGWLWHPGGQSVSAADLPWVEWTPVRQWEKDHGYRQQYYWGDGGNSRYARYVDSAGRQIGPVVQTYKESKFAKILGNVVRIVAGTVVTVAGGAAIATVATGAAGAAGAAGGAAPGAAETITAAAAAPAATTTAAEIATAAAVPAASVVAPAAAGAGATSAITAALPTLATVAKTVTAVAPIAKMILSNQAKQDMANAAATPLPIAPPANMIPPPSGLMPSTPQQFSPIPGAGGSTPSWLIPAAIGGVGLLALVMMNRRRQPTRRRV